MGHQYGGTAIYPVDYSIPDDGDDVHASSVNVAFEALGDRTEWLREQRSRQTTQTFTTTQTVTVPEGAFAAVYEMCGAGGGGGSGATGFGADKRAAGGGGGGGALRQTGILAATPGDSWEITRGSPGTGGALPSTTSGSPGNAGSPGGSSKIRNLTSSTDLAIALGGNGGHGGICCDYDEVAYALGGGPVQNSQVAASVVPAAIVTSWPTIDPHRSTVPHEGAYGATSNAFRVNTAGNRSAFGSQAGGINGANSVADDGAFFAGGGGGGGGAGPYGSGASGGDGGAASQSGAGTAGTSAIAASPNTGAGGGGGGGGGGGNGTGGRGGGGSSGGTGGVTITWLIRGDDS